MNELEMCKVIAGLEGVNLYKDTQLEKVKGFPVYNPITDLALNCALRDKYHVEIDYENMKVAIHSGGGWRSIVDFFPKGEVNHAVIECILKANGLYVHAEPK